MLKWIEKMLRKIRQKKDNNVFLLTVHINHDDLVELIKNDFKEFNEIHFDYYRNTMLGLKNKETEEILEYRINKVLVELMTESYKENVLDERGK